MSNIKIISQMLTVYRGFTIALNPFTQPQTWLVYLGAEFIAKVATIPDAWAIIDARLAAREHVITVEAL